MKLFRCLILLGLLFVVRVAFAAPIVPHLVVKFDSLLEGPPIPTIAGNDSLGAPVTFAPSPPAAICNLLLAAFAGPIAGATQCLLSDPAKFPNLRYDGGVNLTEGIGPEPGGGSGHGGISDTVEIHLRAFQTPLGSVFAGIIIYTTDFEGSLAPIPGAANIAETGDWQDISNSFFDFNTGAPGLPNFLLPPTATDPHTFAALQIIVRSDVPEPGTIALLIIGLVGMAYIRGRVFQPMLKSPWSTATPLRSS